MAVSKTAYATQFVPNYEVKNGFVGDAQTLNKAVDQVKREVDAIFGWIHADLTADSGSSSSLEIGIEGAGNLLNETIASDLEYDTNGWVSTIGAIDTRYIVYI